MADARMLNSQLCVVVRESGPLRCGLRNQEVFRFLGLVVRVGHVVAARADRVELGDSPGLSFNHLDFFRKDAGRGQPILFVILDVGMCSQQTVEFSLLRKVHI